MARINVKLKQEGTREHGNCKIEIRQKKRRKKASRKRVKMISTARRKRVKKISTARRKRSLDCLIVGDRTQRASFIQYGYGNVEHMQKYFPKHLLMGTAKMKYDIQSKNMRREEEIWKKAQRAVKKDVPTA